jgi:hypothetical protein
MNKFSVDYSSLHQGLNREKCFRLKDVEHRLQKVAFDVVRFIDSDTIDGLWQIRKDENGEYIVATYEDGSMSAPVAKVSSAWSVVQDKSGEQVSIFYQGTPVTKVSLAFLGIPKEESAMVCSYLPHKLATNSKLVTGLLNDLPLEQKRNLLDEYPELGSSSKK